LKLDEFILTLTKPGKFAYIFRIGSSKAPNKFSNYVKSNFYVCGLETLEIAANEPFKANYDGDGKEYSKTIKFSDYNDWFKFDASDEQASELCGISEFKMVVEDDKTESKFNDAGPENKVKIGKENESDILIDITNKAENEKVYLQATTKGGIVKRKEIILTIEPYKCVFTIDTNEAEITVGNVPELDVY